MLGRAFERWEQVTAARDPHAYVRRMIVNEFMTWQRRRARTIPHLEVGRLVDLGRAGSGRPSPITATFMQTAPNC